MARKKKYKVSKQEKEILALLKKQGLDVIAQFRITGLPYIFDFLFPEYKILLEYQGNYWHCNPNKYKADELIKMAGIREKILVNHIWDRDELKRRSAEKQGYKVIYLWESDFKSRGWEAIRELLEINKII